MKSIAEKMESLYEINKSKFIGVAFPVFSIEEIKSKLEMVKKEHTHATHICYAYILNSGMLEKCSDDGEPSGTAGKPILDVLKKKELENILLVVVRYFGGIKLGAGGLTRAYSTSASDVLSLTKLIEFERYKVFEIYVDLKNASNLKNQFKQSLREVQIDYNDFVDGKVKVHFASLHLPAELKDAKEVGEINLIKEWEMVITKLEIQKNNKEKFNLYLDGEFYSGIYIDACIKYGLKVGLDLSQEELDKIIFDSNKTIALTKTANYVNTALKTEKQVKEYIAKKGFDKSISEYVIEKLKEYKYIDDEAYAKAYISTYQNKFGAMKLKANLSEKGVKKEIVENLLKDVEIDEDILYNLSVKYMKNKESTYENQVKLMRFLASRGFSYDDINSIIDRLKKEEIC